VVDLYGFLFNMIFISGWNAIEITTIESYPTHLRYELSGLNVLVQASPNPDTTDKSVHRNGFSANYFTFTLLMCAHSKLNEGVSRGKSSNKHLYYAH
jgi:hypothetical protein